MANPIRAVIFDWAGTVVDYGCFAPMNAFLQCFEQAGVSVTPDEVRQPMGLLKRDHIQALLNLERVKTAWLQRYGRQPEIHDLNMLYSEFQSLLMSSLAEYAELIPGALETIDTLRGRGLKIGSTTGYTRAMMDVIAPLAWQQGYKPDYLICSDEVQAGRPYPYMIYRNMMELGVFPPFKVVKVGDTTADVLEGRNAGVWTVAIISGSSELGLTQEEMDAMSEIERNIRKSEVRQSFERVGAHLVIDSIRDLPAAIQQIEERNPHESLL